LKQFYNNLPLLSSTTAQSTDCCAIDRSLRNRPIAALSVDPLNVQCNRLIAQRNHLIVQIGRQRTTWVRRTC